MLFLLGSILYRAGTEWHGNAIKKRRFAAWAQTLNAHCSVRFASFAALTKGYSIPRGESTAVVSGRTGEMCGLWACHKIQLENHQQLVFKNKTKTKTNAKWWHQR